MLLPIGLDTHVRRFPFASLPLAAVCVLIGFLQLFVPDVRALAVTSEGAPYTLVTHMFVHAGPFHLFGNVLLLYITGVALEQVWDSRVVAGIFLTGGLLTGIVYTLVAPADLPGVGASGAIAAFMGAFLVRVRNMRIRLLFVLGWVATVTYAPGTIVVAAWFIFELLALIQEASLTNLIHVVGFAYGAAAALLLRATGLDASVVHAEQVRKEIQGSEHFDRGLELLETVTSRHAARQAMAAFEDYLEVQPNDGAGHEGLARARRAAGKDHVDAGALAIRAYLTAGDAGAAARVRAELDLPLAPAELLRLHRHLPDGRDLLTRFIDERPDDPHAPKAMLTIAEHYPEAASTSRIQTVYDHTRDLEWQTFLEPLLAPRAAPG